MITLRYFARLREELNIGEETLTLPVSVTDTQELRNWLQQRGPQWQQALADDGILVAVNQQVANWQQALTGDEEIAFFPPVTGG